MPLIISHPETNPKIRKIEDEIAAKKEKLAALISKEKGTLISDYTLYSHDASEFTAFSLLFSRDQGLSLNK